MPDTSGSFRYSLSLITTRRLRLAKRSIAHALPRAEEVLSADRCTATDFPVD